MLWNAWLYFFIFIFLDGGSFSVFKYSNETLLFYTGNLESLSETCKPFEVMYSPFCDVSKDGVQLEEAAAANGMDLLVPDELGYQMFEGSGKSIISVPTPPPPPFCGCPM